MNKYKIKQIYIKNFKLVKEALIDFDKNDIIVLDGPNGFGKTTIFDALELVLTGNVSRIKDDDGRRSYKDFLFSRDGSNQAEILLKVEFKDNEQNKITVVKRLDPSVNVSPIQKKPTNFSMFTTHLLNSFDEEISNENKKSQKDIERVFSISEIDRIFNLYYYIQQEESTRYLKSSEKERKQAISHLFNTKIENEEIEKLKKMKNCLQKENKKIENKLKEIGKELNSISDVKSIQEEEEFEILISTKNLNEWDLLELTIDDNEKRNLYINELNDIKNFVKYSDVYYKILSNNKINSLVSNKDLLRNTIILGQYLEEFKSIESQYEKQEKYEALLKITKDNELILNLKREDYVSLEQDFKIKIDIDKLITQSSLVQVLKKEASSINNVLVEINEIRDLLLEKHKEYEEIAGLSNQACPFCDKEWNSKKELHENIEKKRNKYLSLYDIKAKELENEINYLEEIFIVEVTGAIKSIYQNSQRINPWFFEQLKSAYNHKELVRKFIRWCGEKNIFIDHYFNKNFNQMIQDIEINNRLTNLVSQIESLKEEIVWGIEEYDLYLDKFNWIYQNVIDQNIELIEEVTEEKINRKIQYIKNIFDKGQSSKRENLKMLATFEEGKKTFIEETLFEINQIIGNYIETIKEYELSIINDIETIFYIYSGRILQYYQRGMGIFIANTASGLKFISNNETDHDAVNYLSSGQLAALVLSFTFTLNKIYSKSHLGVLLIDDPVQSMDDINMASLAELLRNEFSERQIIMSTHEDNVSRFLRYRFSNYGLAHKSINVKEKI